MIVSLNDPKSIDPIFYENVDCVVRKAGGFTYLCRDGQPDEFVGDNVTLVVTP